MLTNSPDIHQKNLFGNDLLEQFDPSDPLLKLVQVIPGNDFYNGFLFYERVLKQKPKDKIKFIHYMNRMSIAWQKEKIISNISMGIKSLCQHG